MRVEFLHVCVQEYFLHGPRPLWLKEIVVLLVHPGKAYVLLTDHLIAGQNHSSLSLLRKGGFRSNILY